MRGSKRLAVSEPNRADTNETQVSSSFSSFSYLILILILFHYFSSFFFLSCENIPATIVLKDGFFFIFNYVYFVSNIECA